MFRLRLAILGATAALALGTATAFAMTELGTSGDSDSHGDAVASAARNCPHGAGGVHGACVSSVARTNGQGQDEGQSEDQGQPAKVEACKAAIRTSDKPGHRGIGACVSGRSTSGAGTEPGS